MITNENLGSIMGAPVVGPDDDRIGTVGQVFVDPISGSPNWVTVQTGLFGRHENFVPLDDADWDREVLRIPYEKGMVKGAPRIDTDEALDAQTEDELYRYYGLSSVESGEPSDDDDDDSEFESDVDDREGRTTDVLDERTDDDDAARPAGEPAGGGMRLRKYVVTEQQEVTVPVTREEVRLEPEPEGDQAPESVAEPASADTPKRNQKGRHRA